MAEKEEDESLLSYFSFYRDTWKVGLAIVVVCLILFTNDSLVDSHPTVSGFALLAALAYFIGPLLPLALGILCAIPLILLMNGPTWIGKVFGLDEDEVILRLEWVIGTIFVVWLVLYFFSGAQ